MFILAIDQASTSGYCYGDTRFPRMVACGETKTHADRASVVQSVKGALILAREQGCEGFLHVVLEDHSDFYFGYGNTSVKTLLGMGKAHGEWSTAILDVLGPDSWHSVTPKVWRKAVLGLAGNVDSERAKKEACTWARAWLGREDVGPDASEAVAIWAWSANNLASLMVAEEIERQAARERTNEKAKERRAAKRKGAA